MSKSVFYKSFIRPIKHFLAFLIIWLIIKIARILPYGLSTSLFSGISSFYGKFNTRDRRRAIDNIKLARNNGFDLPDNLLEKCFESSGRTMAIMFRLSKDIEKIVLDFEGKEAFDRLYNYNKGVIVITGHIGPFELIPAYLANQGYKISVVGKRLFDKRVDNFLVKTRESFGTVNVSSQDSPRKLIKLLRNGYALGILPDVNTKSVANSQAKFFGKETRTAIGPVSLARATGLPILPMAIYTTGNKKFRMVCLDEIIIERTKDKDIDIQNGLKLMNNAIEELILNAPEQWIWYHPRYKK